MSQSLKVLGQAALTATTLIDVYTVPSSRTAMVASIVVANRSATPTTYRVSVSVNGAADDTKQYIAYDAALDANATVTHALGIGLSAGDIVRAYAGAATVSVNVFGVEQS